MVIRSHINIHFFSKKSGKYMHALQLDIHISFIYLPLNQWAFGAEFWQKGQYILVIFAVVSALPGYLHF